MNKRNVIIMQRFLKIVFWVSNSILIFWIATSILGLFIPLEFANNDIEYTYIKVRFCVIPIAVLFAIVGTIKNKDRLGLITIKIFLAICASICSVFMMAVILLGINVCGWITDKVFFENKNNPSTKIIQRHFDCGATDSSPSNPKIFIIREFTPYFIWATEIDTNQIDKNEWIRVENSETENINQQNN